MRGRKASIRIIKVLAVVAALVAAFCAAFLLTAPQFVVVSDAAWSLVLPKAEVSRMRLSLALRWHRLVVVQADASSLADGQALDEFIDDVCNKPKVDAVLFGPVASSKIVEYYLDAGALLADKAVYGIYGTQTGLFDATLVPAVEQGWIQASEAVRDEVVATSRNVAIVSDSKGSVYNEAIVSILPQGMATEYIDEDGARLFVSNTLEDMNRLGIVIGMCPRLDGFYTVFDRDDTISWIVDYRYSTIVPSRQLHGIVLPDLSGFAKTAPLGKQDAKTIGADGLAPLGFKYDGR